MSSAGRVRKVLPFAFAAVVGGVLIFATCSEGEPPESATGAPSEGDTAAADLPPFDAERAFDDLERMVERDQRYYGAPEREQAFDEIVSRFGEHVAETRKQRIQRPHPDGNGRQITLINALARQHPDKPRRVVLGSHWDTRLWAEEDPDPERRDEPITGANDGTSGVAVMLEIARALEGAPLKEIGVDYVLFDGEEYGQPGNDEYCQGSEHLADHMSEWWPDALPEAAIVMDMVADEDLQILHEKHSKQRAGWLHDLVWEVAREQNVEAFEHDKTLAIYDDHTPLLDAGVPAILLIDYDYPYWHTHADTLDKCSAKSMGEVGGVVLGALQRLDRAAAPRAGSR